MNKKFLTIPLLSLALIFGGATTAMGQVVPQNIPSVTLLGGANVEILSNTTIPGVSGVALQSKAGAQAVYNAANALSCTNTISGELGGQTINSSSSLTVVCVNGSANLSGDLTINAPANGVVVIRVPGNLTLGSGSRISLGNGTPNSLFFQVNGNATIDPGATAQGTILATGNIVVDPSATLNGRAISLNGTVTADPADINCPSCIATSTFGGVTITKNVINDNGGTATASNFEFFIGGLRVNPGTRYAFVPGTYAVSELMPSGSRYLASPWGGSCTASGNVTLTAGVDANCTITNNDLAQGTITPTSTPTTTPTVPQIPNTGTGANMALIIAIIGGSLAGVYLTSRGIKNLNR